MKPERFRQIRNLFDAALERDPASRAAFVGEACQGDETLRAEIERLIAAHLETAPLLDRIADRPELLKGELGRMEGRRIGNYEVLRELGHGGMGTVYLAVRTDDVYRKPVALKIVRPDAGREEVIARFRREREILASLDHPNLARLLDGGTTDEGLPYFVMDFVEGQPIHHYCDQRQWNIRERLKLFQAVCAAVEYAHSRGVVHRDLKPGNILVTAEGTVKLLDFGIAKLLGASQNEAETATFNTRTGMLLMTPEYASPEQIRGENTGVASDVYSLGVVLYELLTGRGPYRMRSRLIHEVVRVICEEQPDPPSTAVTTIERRSVTGDEVQTPMTPQSISAARAATPSGLRRELSGDPDKIVLKALRKEPAQRYRSAAAFGEDIRRSLEGLPVLAHGQSVFYRSRKLLTRHRGWIFAAVLLGAGLVTGAVKVSLVAVAYLAGFLLILLTSYLMRHGEAGRDQALRGLFPGAVALVCCFALGVTSFRLFHNRQSILTAGMALFAAYLAVLLGRWPLRERWAGGLLLDASRPKPWIAYVWVTAMLVAVAGSFFSEPLQYRNAFHIFFVLSQGLFAAYFYFFWNTVEIRRNGILIHGQLMRWSTMESYSWEPAANALAVLRIQARRSGLHFYRLNKRATLPEAQKPRVAEILSRQLAEWPEVGQE